MKNKNLIIFLIVGLLIVVGAGALILAPNKKVEPVVEQAPLEEQVFVIKPEDIGLTLTMSADGKKVIIEVANTKGIVGLEYQLSYTSKGDISRGAIGNIDIKQPGKSARLEIPLGTCSDVCHYDEDVSEVKLILKVAKTDGTTSQAEKSLEL